MPTISEVKITTGTTGNADRARRMAGALTLLFAVAALSLYVWLAVSAQRAKTELADASSRLAATQLEANRILSQRTQVQQEVDTLAEEKKTLRQENERLRIEQEHFQEAIAKTAPPTEIAVVRAAKEGRPPAEIASALWKRGSEAHQAGQPDRADAMYRAALKEDPSYAPALNGLGLLAADRGDRATAEKYYLSAVAKNPTYAHGLYNLANLYFLRRKFDDAEKYAKRALDVDPNYDKARSLLKTIEKNHEPGAAWP